MKKRILIVLMMVAGLSAAFAQKEDKRVLLTIDNQPVTVSEFLYVYNKNNKDKSMDKKAVEDYLDLYINFRLKVMQAEKLGMDTLPSFKNELAGYRAQLARPYLTDKEVNERLLKEAYDRLQWDIRASHIMIFLPENVDEDDSIARAAYQKLMDIRKRALKGEDFAALARQYSDDPSARDRAATDRFPARKGNGGDLGYFTAFYMVYPFETAAYNTPVGEISMPVRTRFGYHIIKVTDKIPALGTIHVAHINIRVPQNTKDADKKAEAKIDEIYQEITSGKISFEDAARKYSDDKGSGEKGGALNWFEVSKMVPEFISAISKIDSIGGISKPVKTEYGWHIIKLLDLRKVPPYEQYLPELKQKVARDSRSNKSREAAIAKFKEEYHFKEYPKALESFYAVVDSTIFERGWKKSKAAGLNKVMFKLGKKKYTQQDFAGFLEKNQAMAGKGTIRYAVHRIYNQWVNNTVMAYKDSRLEDENFDFRMLVNEYHDGILLFNISDEKVWGKAIKDTAGLEKFYEAHKKDYMWGDRVEAEIFKAKNDSLADVVIDLMKKDLDFDSIIHILNNHSQLNVGFEKGKYEKGDNKIIDAVEWKTGISKKVKKDQSIYVVRIRKLLPPQPKQISEARGLITADYQNYLQDEWIKELRKNADIKINQKVLESIEK